MNNYFYCYSPKLKTFILNNGLKYITRGIHNKTRRCFWVFEKTDQLDTILKQWN